MSSRSPNRTRKIVIRMIALVLALLICAVLYDLYFPRTTHMRVFDRGLESNQRTVASVVAVVGECGEVVTAKSMLEACYS